ETAGAADDGDVPAGKVEARGSNTPPGDALVLLHGGVPGDTRGSGQDHEVARRPCCPCRNAHRSPMPQPRLEPTHSCASSAWTSASVSAGGRARSWRCTGCSRRNGARSDREDLQDYPRPGWLEVLRPGALRPAPRSREGVRTGPRVPAALCKPAWSIRTM